MTRVFRLISLLICFALTLGILEVGLRVWWIKGPAGIGAGLEDPHFHHRLKPNTTYHYTSDEFDVGIRTNRFGLRGPDPVIPKPPGKVRVLMLGDSFTFGFPVRDNETFCALAEQRLRERGLPVEIVNGGVSGYSPTLEYLSLRDQFLAFEPDLVVLWYDLGDLQEDHWYQKNLRYDAAGRIVGCDPRYVNGRFDRWQWIKERSALAKYVDVKILRVFHWMRILGPVEYVKVKLRGERAKVAAARLKTQQHAPDLGAVASFLLVRETSTPELVAPVWQLSARYLRMIHELLRERNIPFVIGVYPYGMVVGPDQWAKGRTYWGFAAGKTYDAGLARATFRRFAEQEGVPLIDSYDRFRAADQRLFYDWDGHMTAAGHATLAAALTDDPAFLALLRRLTSQRGDGGA